MDPYQAYRRGLISYATYVAKMDIDNINVTDTVDEPIDPGDYSAIIANATVIAGADTMATNNLGILVAVNGSITLSAGGSLTLSN